MDGRRAREVLGIGPGAGAAEAKAAYRRLALGAHPDRGGDGGRFAEISEAYGAVRDGAARPPPRPAPGPRGPRAARRPRRGPARGDGPQEDWSRRAGWEDAGEAFWAEYERRFWEGYEARAAGGGAGPGPGPSGPGGPEPRPVFPRVDASLCIGCCSCEAIAPGAFSVDRDRVVNPKSRVTDPGGAPPGDVMSAAETCPTRAISVDDAATGERLFPL